MIYIRIFCFSENELFHKFCPVKLKRCSVNNVVPKLTVDCHANNYIDFSFVYGFFTLTN